MKIGELSSATATPVETIRFYERERLLVAGSRTHGNYRVYGQADAERLSFIRHCRSLDMTLDEIRVLLRFKDAPQANCRNVNDLLEEHIGHVAERIRELKMLENQLKQLRQQCRDEASGSSCGILEGLTQSARKPVVKRRSSAHTHGTHGRR
jgi:Cd(II)/Pb(II)-responsive transcriptional regulator